MSKVKKGYKDTEVGIIPEDWENRLLKELTFQIIDGTHHTPNYTEYGVPFLRVTDIQSEFINLATLKYISKKEHEQLKKRCFPKQNDVLLSKNGTIGISKLITWDWEFSIFVSLALIKVKRKLEPLFLHYFLSSNYIKKQIQQKSKQGTVTNLHLEEIKELLIPIPKIQEQQAIAEALSDIDALIDTLNKQIEKKKNIKQGAIQELLTGKKRLQGFEEEWEEKTLGEISLIIMGQSPLSIYYNKNYQGLPLIQGNADIGDRKTINRIYTTQITKQCDKEDIILSVRAPVGTVAKASSKACIGRGVCAIKTDNNFLYHYLVFAESDWTKYSKGSTFDSISSDELKNIPLTIPLAKEEQTAIAQILTDMDNEIEQLEKKRDKYLNLKSGMMQQLLTGQIRLLNQEVKKESKVIDIRSVQPKKHSKQFDDAVIISFLVNKFTTKGQPLSRFLYTKYSYLIHRKQTHSIAEYKKFAAGPYNPTTKYGGPEKIGQENNYFYLVKDNNGYDAFVAGENIQEAVDYFIQWYGADMQFWIEQFQYIKPWNLETLATVDMAVYDLREKGIESTVASVKTYLSSIPKWQAKLNKSHFSDRHIQYAIDESIRLFKI